MILPEAAIVVLRHITPAALPRVDEIGTDLTVLLFTILISVLSGALFGLIAVVRFGKPRAAALREGGRSSSDGPVRHRTRNALVVSQVALALTLLVVSGLMIRTFVAMRQVHPGFLRPEQVQTFRVAIPTRLISDGEQVARAPGHRRARRTGAGHCLRRSCFFGHHGDDPSRALGKRVRGSPTRAWHEIVGVVGDERDDGLNHPATAIVYWPMLSDSYRPRTMAYAVRSNQVGAPGFLGELQQAVWSINPSQTCRHSTRFSRILWPGPPLPW